MQLLRKEDQAHIMEYLGQQNSDLPLAFLKELFNDEISEKKIREKMLSKVLLFLKEKGYSHLDLLSTGVESQSLSLLMLALIICLDKVGREDYRDIITQLILVYNAFIEIDSNGPEQFRTLTNLLPENQREFFLLFLKRSDEDLKPECVSYQKVHKPFFHYQQKNYFKARQ